MEYLWPARRARNIADQRTSHDSNESSGNVATPHRRRFPPTRTPTRTPTRSSFESATRKVHLRQVSEPETNSLSPPAPTGLRKLGASRSFNNLREAASRSTQSSRGPSLSRTRSTELLSERQARSTDNVVGRVKKDGNHKQRGDAAEMRTRSHQKTFVLVRISRFVSFQSWTERPEFNGFQSPCIAEHDEGRVICVPRGPNHDQGS